MLAQNQGNKKGFVAMISVLIISAVAISIATTFILLGLGFSRSSLSLDWSNQAKAIVSACVEVALENLRDVGIFSGSGTIFLGGGGSCTYNVSSSGQSAVITGSSSGVNSVIRKVNARAAINKNTGKITLNSWLEVQ